MAMVTLAHSAANRHNMHSRGSHTFTHSHQHSYIYNYNQSLCAKHQLSYCIYRIWNQILFEGTISTLNC